MARVETYDTAFPQLKAPELHTYFKEQLLYLFFNLTTKNKNIDNSSIKLLQEQCIQVLQLLKKQLQNESKQEYSSNEWIPYLELFYRMIAQTRDISNGKGEHELSYMLIYVLYEVFPVLAIYMVHRFVQPLPGSQITYGCWRDIKYLCDYIYLCSTKHEDHGLLQICIELMNNQLYKDMKNIINYQQTGKEFDLGSISNVAKWIPREHKQFDWLYNLLVLDWAKHHPYILQTCRDGTAAYSRATNKLKSIYRKLISSINHTLDTMEIKQCSRKLDEIDTNHVSIYTVMKQRRLVFAEENKPSHFSSYFENLLLEKENQTDGRGHGPVPVPGYGHYTTGSPKSTIPSRTYTINYFIKNAIRLLQTNDVVYGAHYYEMEVLKKQWNRFSNSFEKYKFENILPIIDMSFYMQMMDADSYYNAIGIALLIAEKSSFGKRILVLDHQPTWVSLEDSSGDLFSMIQTILSSTKSSQNTKPRMDKMVHLLLLAIQNVGISGSILCKMKFVFLSNFMFLENMWISELYNIIYEPFVWSCKTVPCFVFWNLSTKKNIEIESGFIERNVMNSNILLLSGATNAIYSYFELFSSRYLVADLIHDHGITYQSFCHIMKHPRYDIVSKYLQSVYGM